MLAPKQSLPKLLTTFIIAVRGEIINGDSPGEQLASGEQLMAQALNFKIWSHHL